MNASAGNRASKCLLFQGIITNVSSVQFSRSVVSYSVTPWTEARPASLSITNSQSLLKLMSVDVPFDHVHPNVALMQTLNSWISGFSTKWSRRQQ